MPLRNKLSYYWLSQFGGWGFYVLLYTFYYYTINFYYSDFPFYFHTVFCEAITGLVVSHLMRKVIKESKLLDLSMLKQIIWMVIITLGFSLIYSSLVVTIEELMGWEMEYFVGASFVYKWARTALGGGLFFTIWSLIYLTYHYVVSTQAERLNQAKLEAVVKELELKTIKAHINPHFIFNALNSIRALIDENPHMARNAVTELSQLLRSSMNAGNEELVTLERELTIVKNYLALEQIRFEDRLKVRFEIDNDTLKQPIPPMMLQTLVENAIKHGISKEMLGGEIVIISDFVADHHEIKVQNTGRLHLVDAAMNPKENIPVTAANKGRAKAGEYEWQPLEQLALTEGFGISSTRNRLQLLFGKKASFGIENIAGHRVEATVQLPVMI